LTPRQTQVLDGIARGWSNRRIAEALCITEQSAKNCITGLMRALGVGDRRQAVVRAVQEGLVQLRPVEPDRAA
jgi:DNA-binding NarL/FixJ family response regulator